MIALPLDICSGQRTPRWWRPGLLESHMDAAVRRFVAAQSRPNASDDCMEPKPPNAARRSNVRNVGKTGRSVCMRYAYS